MTRSTSWSALHPLAISSIAFLFLSCIHLCNHTREKKKIVSAFPLVTSSTRMKRRYHQMRSTHAPIYAALTCGFSAAASLLARVDVEEDEAAAESRRAAAASMAARRPSREEGERRGGLAAGYGWRSGAGATPRVLVVFVSSCGCGRRGACKLGRPLRPSRAGVADRWTPRDGSWGFVASKKAAGDTGRAERTRGLKFHRGTGPVIRALRTLLFPFFFLFN
jgi:hypothetical protein